MYKVLPWLINCCDINIHIVGGKEIVRHIDLTRHKSY